MNGSDLHLKVGSAPKVRVDGHLVPIEGLEPLTPLDTEEIADAILTPLARQQFLEQMDADFAYAAAHVGRFRVNVFRQRGSIGVVMRHVT
ncbi:MAG: twitching motility protein PilT [Candidatus Poriferisodalaceae bacterium]